MSEETVQEVIIKAVSDPEFRELLFSDPDKALEGYELTKEEVESLKQIERESFDKSQGELEERVSRAGISARQLGLKLNIGQTGSRQTPKTDFGTTLKEGLSSAEDEILDNVASPYLPGGDNLSSSG